MYYEKVCIYKPVHYAFPAMEHSTVIGKNAMVQRTGTMGNIRNSVKDLILEH